MLRFDRAYSPQKEVREKCIEATRFARVPGGQWEGATAAGTKLDEQFEKYPKFEINKVATELNRIIAEYRNNRITVKFRPGDREASEELANKLNGLFRADYEETDGGEHIPLIPVYGKRWFIDDIERVEGHIAKAMDPQRLYNLQVSMLADTAAQDPGQIPIVGMEQIRGLEKHWEARNKKRPAFLPLREVRDKSGNIIAGATPAGYTQPAVMNQALAALLQQTSADIQEVTGGSQAMQQMPSNIAQETVNNLMNRADMASFIYLDNMAKSLKRAGEVWLSMAREVYGSEREVRIVNEDGSDDIAVLSAQVVDRQTGAVVALNDLSVGRYDVTVDVGPSYTARRDATVSVLTNVLSSMLPTDPMRPAIQGIILDNIDGEGLDDFKEYNRNQLLISGIAKPRNEKEQQIVQQAQMAAQSQPNPEMVLAQAQMVAAQAEAQKATNETAQTQIKAFTAQQDAMESQANTVYKLAQARNIDDKAVMEAIRLLKDVAESQQQQFQSPPQSPADLMPS